MPLAEELPKILAQVKDARKDLSLLSPKAPVSGKVYTAAGGIDLAFAFLEEQPASETEWTDKKEAFLRALRDQERNNVIEGFLADRMKQYKVEIKPEALK